MATELRITRRGVERGLLAAFAIPLLIALAASAYDRTLYLSHSYNEGWNAFLDAAAANGDPIYFAPDAPFTNNYPPLSFYIVGLIARIAGDALFVGRAIAWLGFLGSAGAITAILRRLATIA